MEKLFEQIAKTSNPDRVKGHDTIILAWDETGAVKYCRTFDYVDEDDEKSAAQLAYAFVSQNFPNYLMGDAEHLLHTKNFIEGRV